MKMLAAIKNWIGHASTQLGRTDITSSGVCVICQTVFEKNFGDFLFSKFDELGTPLNHFLKSRKMYGSAKASNTFGRLSTLGSSNRLMKSLHSMEIFGVAGKWIECSLPTVCCWWKCSCVSPSPKGFFLENDQCIKFQNIQFENLWRNLEFT